MDYLYQDRAKEKVKGWGYVPVLIFCLAMLGALVITKDYGLGVLLVNGVKGLVATFVVWTIYISIWKFLYTRYWYPKDKEHFINYILQIGPVFKFKLVGGRVVEINYKNLKLPTTWRRDQQIVEDQLTGKQYVFTNHIANPNDKQTWWEDGKVVVCFDQIKEILNRSVSEDKS